jgi:anti-anti-sigma regulatory factor
VIFSLFGKKDGPKDERRRPSESDAAPSRPASAPGGRPADAREVARRTAAKIDEIESQMIAAPRPVPVAGARGVPPPARPGRAGTVYVPSGGGAAAMVPSPPVAAPVTEAKRAPATEPDTSVILGESGDAGSLEVAGSALPPAFEEAAVLYANGQAEAAATILSQTIREGVSGVQARQAWAMLFDLHQACGEQAAFESLAIEYSARFESSPPTWDPAFAPHRAEAASAGSATGPATVPLPPALDAQVVKQLEQVQRFAQRNRAVVLDASAVTTVDPVGADLLRRVLLAFAKAQRELAIVGADRLSERVAGTLETGRRDPTEACWLLQLELFRLLGRQQEFEDLSIDYCVTYEVSPPPWEPMPASIRAAEPGGDAPADGSGSTAPSDSGFTVAPDAIALRGEIGGRASELIAALRAAAADRAELTIDCRDLRRLDFVAAGELLNEIVALRTGGKYLVFRDVNHVIAALLAVMGIPDLAEIRLRRH